MTWKTVAAASGEVMTDAEIYELGTYARALEKHFYENIPHSCNCSIEDFALDIEFKIDSEVSPRKIYLKQVRPYR